MGKKLTSADHSREKLVLVTLETVTFPMGPGTGKWDINANMKINPNTLRDRKRASQSPILNNGGEVMPANDADYHDPAQRQCPCVQDLVGPLAWLLSRSHVP